MTKQLFDVFFPRLSFKYRSIDDEGRDGNTFFSAAFGVITEGRIKKIEFQQLLRRKTKIKANYFLPASLNVTIMSED